MNLTQTANPAPQTAPAVDRHRAIPWGTRLLAASGFVLAGVVVGLFVSQQIAQDHVREYVRQRYRIDVDVPVTAVRPDFIGTQTASGRPAPPLGFCWAADVDCSLVSGEIRLNPWTHEVVDWHVSKP